MNYSSHTVHILLGWQKEGGEGCCHPHPTPCPSFSGMGGSTLLTLLFIHTIYLLSDIILHYHNNIIIIVHNFRRYTRSLESRVYNNILLIVYNNIILIVYIQTGGKSKIKIIPIYYKYLQIDTVIIITVLSSNCYYHEFITARDCACIRYIVLNMFTQVIAHRVSNE